MKQYLMGIDVGTSQSKGVITASDGRIAAYADVDHDTVSVRPGFFEHDPENIWIGDLKYLVNRLLTESGIHPEEISSIGISAIGPCVLLTDGDGKPLRNAILYGIDTRAEKEIEQLNKRYSEDEQIRRFGNTLSAQSAGPKLLWLREHEPDLYAQARMIMTATSYLVYRLTGKNVMDYYTACAGYTPLFDYENMCWDEEILNGFGCSGKMPELMWSAKAAGKITCAAAEEFGLSESTVVNVGTCDAAAEAVSVGVIKPGRTMVMLGSTAFLIKVLEKPVSDIRLWSAPWLFPGTYSLLGGMSAAGSLTKWFLNEFCSEIRREAEECGKNPYELLAQKAEAVPAGSEGLIALPYFCGERTPVFDSNASGVFFGLHLHHTKMHLYRAILESVAYGIRDNLEVLDLYEKPALEVAVAGGGCKNPLWLQTISNTTGKRQVIFETTLGAAYGDAFLGGMASGLFCQAEEIEKWICKKGSLEPELSKKDLYDEGYHMYKELYRNTKMCMKVNKRNQEEKV